MNKILPVVVVVSIEEAVTFVSFDSTDIIMKIKKRVNYFQLNFISGRCDSNMG